jgi:hypothetical protein
LQLKSDENLEITVDNKVAAAGNRKKAKMYKLATSNLIVKQLDMVIK